MEGNKRQNAIIALLSEYKKAIIELQHVIEDIEAPELTIVIDHLTDNPDCKSIQTILAHVVSSGYSYAVYIQSLKNGTAKRPLKMFRLSADEYKKDLDNVLTFTNDLFSSIYDHEIEEFDNEKKIKTSWGQFYDIEQIMEHAIVHILRHRLQIEKFRTKFKSP
ncbi:MAG: DinB family protein [Ferruginibacter sp.]